MKQGINIENIKKYKLSKEQIETYEWLKKQNINTDDHTLCYWVKSYTSKRLREVVDFAKTRIREGQEILNLGGWIQKFLKTGHAVIDDNCKINQMVLQKFLNNNMWDDLKVYEKHIKDVITGDDLPLTLACEDFVRALEALYQRSKLYRKL